jgi:hypothetical protein
MGGPFKIETDISISSPVLVHRLITFHIPDNKVNIRVATPQFDCIHSCNKKVGNWPTKRPMRSRYVLQHDTNWRGVELGDRVSYPAKACHIKHNLSVETDMLSCSVYEPIAIHILCEKPSPHLGVES